MRNIKLAAAICFFSVALFLLYVHSSRELPKCVGTVEELFAYCVKTWR